MIFMGITDPWKNDRVAIVIPAQSQRWHAPPPWNNCCTRSTDITYTWTVGITAQILPQWHDVEPQQYCRWTGAPMVPAPLLLPLWNGRTHRDSRNPHIYKTEEHRMLSTTTMASDLDQVHELVQERRNSSALAMELRLSCTNPSKCHHHQ